MSEYSLNPWSVSEADYPANAGPVDKLRFLLNYAVLAPSGHNSQPWLFKLAGDEVELRADRARALPVVDPDDRELIMSCGAALLHLRVAIRHFGYADVVSLFPNPGDPDLLARVGFGEKRRASEEESSLLRAIPKRRTNRQPFDEGRLSNTLIFDLQSAARDEGVWLHFVNDYNDRNALAELVAQGDRIQAADKHFRRELAAWVHPNRSQSRDGMPGYAYGAGDLASYAGPLVIRTFDWGKGQAARDRQLATGSPHLAVLGTETDTPAAWLSAGQALARVLLRARVEGVWASYLNQPIEVHELRSKVGEIIGRRDFPQLLLRLGYGSDPKPTPRRPVAEVLL